MLSLLTTLDHSHGTSDRKVVFQTWLGEASDVDTLPEQQAVRATTKMEHAYFITLLDMLAFLDGDLASRHLGHTDTDESHQANVFVVSLEENNSAGGH